MITSFDKTENNSCKIIQPWKYSDLKKIPQSQLVVRGSGLSYCNASVVENGYSIEMKNFNRILEFNETNKTITVESGVQIGDLNNFLIKKGWFIPVLPGYPTITIGGCIAFNIHGKSQFKIGTFTDWVQSITLYHPSYGEITCSRTENEGIFYLTAGGFGFTGLILSATLKISRNEYQKLEINKVVCGNINHGIELIKENSEQYDFIYSWNDLNTTGNLFGRGIVYLEKLVIGKTYEDIVYKNRLNYSEKTPCIHNRFSIQLMCSIYFYLEKLKPIQKKISLQKGSFPIYGKEIYYYLFGNSGFREYQVLFPFENWDQAIFEIKSTIKKIKTPVSLGSLKLFKGSAHNLSFSGNGVCLAIDVPANNKSLLLFKELDKITIKHNGIINLSKDSRADSNLISKLFPQYSSFKENLFAFDPEKKIHSTLRKRLDL